MRSRRGALIALPIAAGLALWVPGAAQAGTASVAVELVSEGRSEQSYERVSYVAAPGEANSLVVSFSGSAATVTDGAGVAAGTGCVPTSSTSARCPLGSTGWPIALRAALGDRDDTAAITRSRDELVLGLDAGAGSDGLTVSGTGEATVSGGPGDDLLVGGRGGEVFVPGPGADRVRGGASDDVLRSDPEIDGADSFSGGPGSDELDYGARSAPVRADLSGDRGGGGAGEGDLIGRDVERLVGGRGDDHLTGDGEANHLRGGSGRDVLRPGSGADVVDGGPGGDRISTRDRFVDRVVCGRGGDRARPDGLDQTIRRQGRRSDCERVRRSRPPRAVLVFTPVGPQLFPRRVDVYLFCPADMPGRCRGGASLRVGGDLVGSRRFSVRRGDTDLLSLPSTPTVLARAREPGGVRAALRLRTERPDRTSTAVQRPRLIAPTS